MENIALCDMESAIEFLMENSVEINVKSSYVSGSDGVIKEYTVTASTEIHDEPKIIAEATIYAIDSAFLEYDDVINYADDISQGLYDMVSEVFTNRKTKSKSKLFYDEETWTTDSIIYVETFEIKKEFRGQGYGTAVAMEMANQLFHRGDDVILVPFAIEDNKNPMAHKRVKSFWETIGFNQIGSSNYYKYTY